MMKNTFITAAILAITFGIPSTAHAATYVKNDDGKPVTAVSSDLDVIPPEVGNEHQWDPVKDTEVKILISASKVYRFEGVIKGRENNGEFSSVHRDRFPEKEVEKITKIQKFTIETIKENNRYKTRLSDFNNQQSQYIYNEPVFDPKTMETAVAEGTWHQVQ